MIDYCKMYMILFHSITDVLIRAQQAAEELYIRAKDYDGK